MRQTVESVSKDEPKFLPNPGSTSALFIQAEDFEDVRKRLAGYAVAMAEPTTFATDGHGCTRITPSPGKRAMLETDGA